jgi:uncharacterized protein YbaP (TraB family)
MRKPLIALCSLLLLIVSSLFSQQLPKTLLWRISGNGLSKPSYVFGTMHVQDPRLFILGDSLLNAISISDGFANEIDLNQITPIITEMMQQELSGNTLVKTVVSKKDFAKYGPVLSKKFNKPADEITTMDILKQKNKWIDDGMNGKKMQTFLDAYLMGLADRQGKWIGGIEDFSDQKGLANTIDESDIRQQAFGDEKGETSELDKMTNIYLSSDLDGVQLFFNGMDSSYKDKLLVKRNHKMSFRMDSLAHVRSMVFAVGAAHLPGTDGLINLLRSRGFRVDPVFSSKKIKPEDYPVHEVTRPWVEVNDEEGRYKVLMPGTPGNIHLYGILNMKIYYNIINGTLYMTCSLPMPFTNKALDSSENEMLKQFFSGTNYKMEKSLEINGIPGRSFVQRESGGYKRIYLLRKESMIYFAIGFSTSEKEVSLKAIDKFFDSYQPVFIHTAQNNNDYTYIDSVYAYEVQLPSKPSPIDNLKSADKTLRAVLMVAADAQTGTYYFCGSNECNRGYVFHNDSSTIRTVQENLRKKYTDISLDTIYSENNNRMLEMNGSMMNNSMRVKSKIILRGNRYYTLLIMYPPDKWNASMDKTMVSFHPINNRESRWRNETSPDSLFTTWAPAGFYYTDGTDTTEANQIPHYESFDSNKVHIYIMAVDTLDTYFWKKNDSALWEYEKDRFVSSSDTILSERIFKKDGLFQCEYLTRPKGSNNITRKHFWLRGNLIYRMSTMQEPETITSENANRFFDQFHFNYAAEKTYVFDSKAAALLKDLLSADTTISRKANDAIPNAPFDSSDILLLQNAVLINYPDDSAVTNSTNGEIAERIVKLNDSSSVFFAKQHYIGAANKEVKNALLDIMSACHTKSNYDSLGKMLVTSPPKFAVPKWITKKWRDSLQLATRLFPTILPLLSDSTLVGDVLDLADAILEDSIMSITMFRPWQHAILHYADRRFRETRADTLYYTVSDYSVIYILQQLKTDSCNAMLKKWLRVDGNEFHKQDIVLKLLNNNQSIPPSALMDLAAYQDTRLNLYRNLKDFKKTALFPAKYLTQSSFAESVVKGVNERFDDEDLDISFIRIKEMKWQGKMSRFFFYDVYAKDDDQHWIAVAGPYNINKISISFSEAQSDVYTKEQYDEANADQQMKELVEQMGR